VVLCAHQTEFQVQFTEFARPQQEWDDNYAKGIQQAIGRLNTSLKNGDITSNILTVLTKVETVSLDELTVTMVGLR
jgi:hypothetical protein